MKWIDVSAPLGPQLTVWPDDPAFKVDPLARIERGDICNVSHLHMSSHSGTHMDAPWHFEKDGKRLDEINPAIFFGQARIVEHTHDAAISADDLGAGPLPERLLLKTPNSNRPLDGAFDEEYVALDPSAASRLVDEKVRLVGTDYLSIAPWTDPETVHHILLGNEIIIVESLRLAHVQPGDVEFVVLPLHLVGADGGPCRAFVGLRD